MKLYSVSLLLIKAIPNGTNNLISAQTLWAESEHEAFGVVYDRAQKKYKNEGYSLHLKVVYEITNGLIKEHYNEQHSDNCETNKCQTSL